MAEGGRRRLLPSIAETGGGCHMAPRGPGRRSKAGKLGGCTHRREPVTSTHGDRSTPSPASSVLRSTAFARGAPPPAGRAPPGHRHRCGRGRQDAARIAGRRGEGAACRTVRDGGLLRNDGSRRSRCRRRPRRGAGGHGTPPSLRERRTGRASCAWWRWSTVPFFAWEGEGEPVLFGREMTRDDDHQEWLLHVWLWKHNPNGMFEDWNPNVSCEHAD